MDGWRNQLFYGDNLDILRRHIADESVDLIYLDPPFNSNRSYNVLFKHKSGEESQAQIEAFDDTWTWSQESEEQYQTLVNGGAPVKVADAVEAMRHLLGQNDVMAYLVMMTARLVELRRVLKPTGSLYLHCDPTASHYLKVILDALFGAVNFRSEIVWKRTGAHGAAKRYAPVHDVILYYGRSPSVKWNPIYHAYSKEYIDSKYNQEDERGRFQLITLLPQGVRGGATGQPWRGIDPTSRGLHWRYPPERLEELDAEGAIYWGRKGSGLPRLKRYLDESQGVAVQDIWTDISPLNSQAIERLGYPTQKPVALLERIIRASSSEGDLILDPFCGCGTAIDAAQRLDRRWIGIDITYLAVDLIEKRLRGVYGPAIVDSFTTVGIPRDVEAAEALWNRSPFEFERWAVSQVDGQPNERQVHDYGYDGVIRFPSDGKGGVERILVSVKGGSRLGPQMVRDLLGAINNQRAAGGVLITLKRPTRGMIEEVRHSGLFRAARHGRSYPKVQIISVQELLHGRRPNLPPVELPYIQARRRSPIVNQLALEDG